MLDVRPVAYIAPVAEQPIGPITPIIRIASIGDEASTLTGLIRIYRKTTDQLLYTSELPVTYLPGHTTIDVAALTPWDPPAPADDDYFILCDTTAINPLVPDGYCGHLGAYTFDVKTVPMGPVPAGHHATHESGGMDEIDLTDLVPLSDYQLRSEQGIASGYPDLNAAALVPTTQLGTGAPNGTKYLRDDQAWVPIPVPNSELPQTLTDQANIAWDLALGGAAQITLGGDRTLNAPTNMVNGAHYSLRVIQDGTGTRLITWNAAYRFPGGVDPCLSAAINCIDLLEFRCDGSNLDCIAMTNALA